MKAALINNFEGIEKVEIQEVPLPTPGENEVQIKIHYAGVNPVDWKIAEGQLKTLMNYSFPIILGWDVAGVVSAVGEKVANLKEGDPVFAYCRKESMHDGSFAQYICLSAKNVIRKPAHLSFAEASCIPLTALTAWQSLFDTAHLKAGESVLIHAGAGGVGGFAIQFAKLTGAHVITTTSQQNFEYVKQLGADEVIDYTRESFVEAILKNHKSGVDVVFDTVGGTTLKMSYQIAKEGGRLITIVGVVDQALARSRQLMAEFVFVQPDGEDLQQIAQLIDTDKLQLPHIQEIPFENVALALRKNREGHTRGKLVLKII